MTPDNRKAEIFVLLEDVLQDRARLFHAPESVVRLDGADGDIAAAFAILEDGLSRGLHAAGFMSYELGYAFEPRLQERAQAEAAVPLLWFGLFKAPQSLTSRQAGEWLAKRGGDYRLKQPPRPTITRETYRARFETTKRMIEAGDIYQLNLTFKADFEIDGDPAALYRRLRLTQPVSHGGLVSTPDFSIVSLSPELFLARTGTRLRSRPMKGTEPRGISQSADARARARLHDDEKQRAENLMIVDLMRNDIGRIARIGSVKVPDLFTVETYPTLHQLTSGVEGEIAEDTTAEAIMRALFPAGSITGAPKIRAMELIHDLEQGPRGVYCGSIGTIAPNRDLDFNVAIRTLVILPDGRGEIGIGSGIVADSEADAEYDEAILKMRFLNDALADFDLFETMLDVPGSGIWLIEEHLERLERSAAHFGFPFDRVAALGLIGRETQTGERLRVRLVLRADGEMSLTKATLAAPEGGTPAEVRYVISPTRLSSDDLFLRHKTTRRDIYDREFEQYHAACGAGEVIYLNESGALCEGSRTNIFVDIGGELLTPPLACGLLPGTLRTRLLADGKARESLLTLADLGRAKAVYLGNSVRGLQPARPVDGQ